MKHFYFNPETKMGYIYDSLPGDGEFIAKGIGIYVAMYLVAALIGSIIILPFLIASGLDKFLISFVSINKNFLIITAAVLVLIKFFTVRLSSALIVRFLFALMILVSVLYILLFKFHMADITIIIGKKFELTGNLLKNSSAHVPWMESLIGSISSSLSKTFFAITAATKSIDYSPLTTSLSTINIAAVLICIGKTILWWALLILFSLLIMAAGFIVLTIVIGLPYFIAIGALVLANNLIYAIKLKYAKHLRL